MSKVYSFRNEPETLTIVDLAGPIIDPADRCILLVHDQRHFGRELHAWPGIYRSLQHHKAAYVIIVTQELVTSLTLNLCSMCLIHDFNGPVVGIATTH